MPTNSVRAEYAIWLATPPVTGILVETMEFSALNWGSTWRMCNNLEDALRATGEDGIPRDYYPIAFTLDRPAIRDSTEMMVNARVDGAEGAFLQFLAGMNANDLLNPVEVVIRVFIVPTMVDRPVWNAPLRFRLEEAKVAVDAITLTLVSGRLPNKRAGRYYGLDRFVGLRPY